VLENIVHRSKQAYITAHNPVDADGGTSAGSLPPTPALESQQQAQIFADPYAHVHPILMRLLQQSKARARALRSEGALSASWSSPRPQHVVLSTSVSPDLGQMQAIPRYLESLGSSLGTSPQGWFQSSEPAHAHALQLSFPARDIRQLSSPPPARDHGHLAIPAEVDMPGTLDFGGAGVALAADPFTLKADELPLDFGLVPFDLGGARFPSFDDPSYSYQFDFT
jgi:hypothetical protein